MRQSVFSEGKGRADVCDCSPFFAAAASVHYPEWNVSETCAPAALVVQQAGLLAD